MSSIVEERDICTLFCQNTRWQLIPSQRRVICTFSRASCVLCKLSPAIKEGPNDFKLRLSSWNLIERKEGIKTHFVSCQESRVWLRKHEYHNVPNISGLLNNDCLCWSENKLKWLHAGYNKAGNVEWWPNTGERGHVVKNSKCFFTSNARSLHHTKSQISYAGQDAYHPWPVPATHTTQVLIPASLSGD